LPSKRSYINIGRKIANGLEQPEIIVIDELPDVERDKHCDVVIKAHIDGTPIAVFVEITRGGLKITEDKAKIEASVCELWDKLELAPNTLVIPVMHKGRRMKKGIAKLIKRNKVKKQPIIIMGCHEKLRDKITI